ncbi:MAG TPA: tetratricopeptide repeat protein [Acidobacteriaceae bacterium]|nr:tetratricopeptide repeat protein [Acidobacteriaceae bacterium]
MKTAAATAKRPRTLAGAPPADAARVQTITQYEAALRLLQEGKYEKAHTAFNQLLAAAPSDLAERIRMYIAACLQQMASRTGGGPKFASNEEHYDYAVSLLNEGQYEDARTELRQIITRNAGADYAFYGLAILASMTGDAHACLEHLTEAIRLNPQNRIQARADSDFQDMADDPRFTELLYPEI